MVAGPLVEVPKHHTTSTDQILPLFSMTRSGSIVSLSTYEPIGIVSRCLHLIGMATLQRVRVTAPAVRGLSGSIPPRPITNNVSTRHHSSTPVLILKIINTRISIETGVMMTAPQVRPIARRKSVNTITAPTITTARACMIYEVIPVRTALTMTVIHPKFRLAVVSRRMSAPV